MRFMNKEISELSLPTLNPIKYMFPYYTTGITADFARFQKSFVDANHQLNPLEKLLSKQAISIRIAAPIDRECELRCDCIDFDKDIAQGSVQCLLGCSYCGNLSNNLIFLNAERCKQNVHAQAEAARYHRDLYNYIW